MPLQEKLFIDGRWSEAEGGGTFEVHNPATGDLAGTAAAGTRTDAKRAVEAAAKAFPAWARTPAKDRGAFLLKFRDLVLSHQGDLARTLTTEQGKPLKEAQTEIGYGADFVTFSAEEAKRVYGETIPPAVPNKRHLVLKQPVGVAAAITPWNFPAAMVTRKIAPALAAGCTVVLKPAEQTPLTAAALFRLIEEVGFPPGVVNLVTGPPEPIGREFLENRLVRKITFTGSTEIGKLLMRGAADQVKKISLELGGHAPFLIFEDADLDKALDGLMLCKFRNAGQTCICANRVLVHAPLVQEFTKRLTEKVLGLKMGPGLDESSTIGPLIDDAAVKKVAAQIEDARQFGGKMLTGGRPRTDGAFAKGHFFEPTVIAQAHPNMKIFREETFGPVAPIFPFRTEEEALRLANDSDYGLAAYAYTKDLSRAVRVMEGLEYGIVGINDHAPAVAYAPFGGFKESGIGREGGRYGLEEFLEVKHVAIGI